MIVTGLFTYGLVNLLLAAYLQVRVFGPEAKRQSDAEFCAYLAVMLFLGLPAMVMRSIVEGDLNRWRSEKSPQ